MSFHSIAVPYLLLTRSEVIIASILYMLGAGLSYLHDPAFTFSHKGNTFKYPAMKSEMSANKPRGVLTFCVCSSWSSVQ